jgi:alkanesulfonate monooxygenase SsuD/methylene tetrahydromethanopterin reductase-like flavin-dependent oxidoreductase (luciferase family)
VAAIPAMAVAAEVTESIRVGARVLCVDYRQPAVLAKELATLDFFSDGRLELGIGAGWLGNEYDAMGIPFDRAGTRLDRMEETIALLRAHFADGGIAGREADIVSLNFDNRSGKFGADGFGTSTAELTAQKLKWIRAGAGDRFDDLEIEIGGYFTVVTPERDETLEKMAPMLGITPTELGESPHALIGSVDAICDQLAERRESSGISYVTVANT